MNSLEAFENALGSMPERNVFKAGAVPRLLSVTECLPFTADRNSPAMIAACQRGTIVHKITEMYDLGKPFDLEETYAGYLAAWVRFKEDTGADVFEVELRVGGEALGYVGTLDRMALIAGKPWLLDIKTGGPWPTHAVQTSAYEHAYRKLKNVKPTKRIRRACVHLKRDGEYKLCEHTSPHDYSVFLAYRRIAIFEIEAGLREQPESRYTADEI